MATNPTFVNVDPATILADILSDFQLLTGKTIEPAQPEYSIASAIAYREVLTKNRINAAGLSMLVDFSTAPVLDYIAALFNITRLAATGAVCTLQFNIVPGHLLVTIPLGTRVASTDGEVIFSTDDDVVVPVGINTVTVTATCQTTGSNGNGYAIGDVQTLMDPYAYISSVANTDITAGGSTEESDDELRARVKLATSKFSVAGSTNAYIYWAKSASALIADVAIATFNDFMPISNYSAYDPDTPYVFGNVVIKNGVFAVNIVPCTGVDPILDNDHWIKPGEVHVFSLLDNGALPTSAINAKILNVLSSTNVRPLTDVVCVKTPSEQKYSIVLDVVKKPDTVGSDLTSSLYTIINDFAIAKQSALGLDIVATYIESICRIDGVYDLTATIVPTTGTLTGRNLVVNSWQVAKMETGGITINITGSNNG
ncbi:MAG: baseplate J/gp47 family protein [Bacteroidota bacterium]|nr:baseplate J/gp47 family protein [Bacteroidota bacterium]